MLLASTNVPPTVEGNQRLEAIGWLWGSVAALLSFATLWWLPGGRWWALLRVFVAGCVGVSFVTTTLCGAMVYNDSRDSGVGTAWMMFIMFGWVTVGATSVIAALVIAVQSRQRP